MKTGAITSAGFYIVPYFVRGRAITIFLELERCYFSPQVWEVCMATWQKCIASLERYHLSTNKLHSPKLSIEAWKLEKYEDGILFINKHATILARCHVSTPLWFPTADDGNQIKTIENKQLTLLLKDFPAEMFISN